MMIEITKKKKKKIPFRVFPSKRNKTPKNYFLKKRKKKKKKTPHEINRRIGQIFLVNSDFFPISYLLALGNCGNTMVSRGKRVAQ